MFVEKKTNLTDTMCTYLQEAEQLYNKMVKKHSANKSVWLGFGDFFFRNGRVESARKLLQRSLNSLEKRDRE